MMVLVTGASSSGKSAFAEERLVLMGEKKRIYLAAMIPWDEECRARIQRHREKRRGKNFETLECPVDVDQARIPAGSAVLLECMSNLTANELYRQTPDGEGKSRTGTPGEVRLAAARERILRGMRHVLECADDLVVVTNEVFDDGIDYGAETEAYRRLLGGLNRELAAWADEAYEVVCGIPVRVK